MVDCVRLDLSNPANGPVIIDMLNMYAMDIMGGSEPITEYTREHLFEELSKRPTAHVFLARVGGSPAGITICFEGFSTFKCKPLLNIHDFAVSPAYRRQGVAIALLEYVEQYAKDVLGCCKLTLEVLEGNHPAKGTYEKFGFAGYQFLDDGLGKAMFWQKYF